MIIDPGISWGYIPWQPDVLLGDDRPADNCVLYPRINVDRFDPHELNQRYSRVFFDFTNDPWPSHNQEKQKLFERLRQDDCYFDWRILTSEFDSIIPTVYLPIFVLAQTFYPPRSKFNLNRTYDFSCLNGSPKWFRVRIAKFLRDNLDNSKSLVRLYVPGQRKKIINDVVLNDDSFSESDVHRFLDDMKTLPNDHTPQKIDLDIEHPAYLDSYVNVVTETTLDGSFISEKTCKPLRAQQFFIIVGPKNSVQHLRDLGFDVFDDIFQDHFYDLESDWAVRLTKIENLVRQIKNLNWTVLHSQNISRLQSNWRKFHSIEFQKQLRLPFLNA